MQVVKKQHTKIVPGGIYRRVDGEKTYYATCSSVLDHKGVISGSFDVCGFPPSRLQEGTDAANVWELLHDPQAVAIQRIEPEPPKEHAVEEITAAFKEPKFQPKRKHA